MGGFLNARVGNLAVRIHNKKDTDNAFEFFTAHFSREGRRSLENGPWFLIYFSKVERAINSIAKRACFTRAANAAAGRQTERVGKVASACLSAKRRLD